MDALAADLAAPERAAALKAAAETVVRAHDATLAPTLRALALVREFIAERDLILYGGLAIDYALRAAGAEGIYDETVLPDYDFYSTDPAGDADDLAGRLVAAGFDEVRAVRAIHATTSKVRAGGVWVADISWCPPALFARMPTVAYRGLRIRAPESQRIDQHLALSRPLNNPPQEDVFHRFPKDLQRFNLLAAAAPPLPGRAPAASQRRAVELKELLAGVPATDWALHGFAAYGLYQKAFGALAAAAGVRAPPNMLPALTVRMAPKTGAVAADIPAADGVPIAPIEIVCAYELNTAPRGFVRAPVMDWRPRVWAPLGTRPPADGGAAHSAADGDLWVYLTADTQYSAARLGGTAVASLQYIAVNFLTGIFTAPSPAVADVYRAYYADLLRMLDAADAVRAAQPKTKNVAALAAPFAVFTGDVIGSESRSDAYWIGQSQWLMALGRAPAIDPADLPPGVAGQWGWGGRGEPRLEFDYAASPVFKIDGTVLAETPTVQGGAPPRNCLVRAHTWKRLPPNAAVLPIAMPSRRPAAAATAACRQAANDETTTLELAGLRHLMLGLQAHAHPNPESVKAFAEEFETDAATEFRARGIDFDTEDEVRARQIAESGRPYATPDFVFAAPVFIETAPSRWYGPLAWADAKSYPLQLATECARRAPGTVTHAALQRLRTGLARQRAKYDHFFGPGVFFGPAPPNSAAPFVLIRE